jgi:hypothetical protein
MAAPRPSKPAAKPPAERRVAAAPEKRSPPAVKKPAPTPARERVLARAPAAPAFTPPAFPPAARAVPAPAVPTRSAPDPELDPESPLAETLRMCRAAGYHATACLKRGCEATRFGLVCRG